MQRKLIKELSRWESKLYEVVAEGRTYLDRDETHYFATKTAAICFMEELRKDERSSKLYKIGNDND